MKCREEPFRILELSTGRCTYYKKVQKVFQKSVSFGEETRRLNNFQRRSYECMCLWCAPVAQFVEHRAVTRKVVSSTPAGPSLRVLKVTEEKVLPM